MSAFFLNLKNQDAEGHFGPEHARILVPSGRVGWLPSIGNWFGKGVSALVLLSFLSVGLAGCASEMVRGANPEKPKIDRLAGLSRPAKAIGLEDDSSGQGEDTAIVIGRSDLIPSALVESEPLPKHMVGRLSFSNTPLQDVLQAVVGDARLSLALVWDNPDALVSRSTVSMTQLGGDLTTVLNKLADSYGFYWQYKEGMLHIAADRQYIAPVPPIADLFESLPIMVRTLGGTDVFLDRSARMITFRAGSQAFSRIKSYLEMTRKNRSLIVYDTYLWEVILNDGSKMGIDWGALPGTVPATAISTGQGAAIGNAKDLLTAGLVNAASGGTGLALSFAGSRFSMNVLVDFLRSQGTINSLSQPKIQLLSGGKATLKDEISTTYVSRVGSSSISAGTVIPGSVETSEVKTGVTLEVSGDVSDGTIYSDIALRVSDLIGMGSATVSGSTITLPKTSSREVHTHVRAKQGDTILLAGIQYDKISNASSSGMGVERSNQADALRSELIIILKPRIKSFEQKVTESPPKPLAQPAPQAAPIIDATPVAPSLATMPSRTPSRPEVNPTRRQTPEQTLPQVDSPAVALNTAKLEPRMNRPTVQAVVREPAPIEPGVTYSEAALKALERARGLTPKVAVAGPLPGAVAVPPEERNVAKFEAAAGVFLHLGAFSDLGNAKSYRTDLERGLEAAGAGSASLQIVSSAPSNQGESYRLLAGPFHSRGLAQQWAEGARTIIGGRPLFASR